MEFFCAGIKERKLRGLGRDEQHKDLEFKASSFCWEFKIRDGDLFCTFLRFRILSSCSQLIILWIFNSHSPNFVVNKLFCPKNTNFTLCLWPKNFILPKFTFYALISDDSTENLFYYKKISCLLGRSLMMSMIFFWKKEMVVM